MVEKRFEKLGMPDIERFENYLPTAFNSELTLLQKVNKIIFDLMETNKLTNEMVDYLNKFIEKFDEKLYKTIGDVLVVWLENGLLADVVREAINEEVIEARTNSDGYVYGDLKERLDGSDLEIDSLKNETNQKINGVKKTLDLKNSHIDNNLKIVMHFNFTDYDEIQENLFVLKDLGYNTLHIQRNNIAITDVTGVKTNAFLKQLKENGFGAILQVDYAKLISNDMSEVRNWIKTIDENENLVGYWYQDEPFDRSLPKDDLIMAYSRLKSMTDKPIFVVDPAVKIDNYTKCFDVFIWNVYLNQPRYFDLTNQQINYALLYDFSRLFFSSNIIPPSQIIPMYPLFQSHEVNGEPPTVEQIMLLTNFFRSTGISTNNMAAFMYHFYDDGKFEDLKSSSYLRYLSRLIMYNSTDSNAQIIENIVPHQLKASPSFISTNLTYSSTYASLVLSGGGDYGEVKFKVSKNGLYTNNELYPYATFHNQGDGKTKVFEVATSYNDIDYETNLNYDFEPTALDNFPKATTKAPFLITSNQAKSVFVRFRIKNKDGSPIEDYYGDSIGFKSIRFAFI